MISEINRILASQVKKLFFICICAELYEGVTDIRWLQKYPVIGGHAKVNITTLMATTACDVVVATGKRCLLVLDAYFAVEPVFVILKKVVDRNRQRLVDVFGFDTVGPGYHSGLKLSV